MATQTIYAEKTQAVTDTPLLIFDCTLVDGTAEHWSTHAVVVNGTAYAARVLQQNVFQMQMASSQGVDGIPGISVTLANADSHFSELEQATGFKGALLTVTFLFYDLRNGVPATDTQVVFQGICNPPDERRESTFRISAGNRMSLQRLLLPEVRIQSRCPWNFPATDAQRMEAIDGQADGKYSHVLPVRILRGGDGREREPERRGAVRELRIRAGGLPGARHVAEFRRHRIRAAGDRGADVR